MIAVDPDVGIVNISFTWRSESGNKLWVVLCSPNTLDGYNGIFAFSVVSDKAHKVLAGRMSRLFDPFPWLRKRGLFGYSVRRRYRMPTSIRSQPQAPQKRVRPAYAWS